MSFTHFHSKKETFALLLKETSVSLKSSSRKLFVDLLEPIGLHVGTVPLVAMLVDGPHISFYSNNHVHFPPTTQITKEAKLLQSSALKMIHLAI